MSDLPPPTKPAPISVLTREQLLEAWLKDLDVVDPDMAQRYRENRAVFPISRHDLVRLYNHAAGHMNV